MTELCHHRNYWRHALFYTTKCKGNKQRMSLNYLDAQKLLPRHFFQYIYSVYHQHVGFTKYSLNISESKLFIKSHKNSTL